MHEMALAESILGLVEETAAAQGVSGVGRVRAVFLDVGELSSVEPEALLFCFDAVTRGSVADGARLEIQRIPGQGWCLNCSRTVPLGALYDPCPECGRHQVQPTAGQEMRVREFELA